MSVLELTRDCYDEIVRHGYEGADREVCGVLAGEYGERASRVVDAYPAENAADAPRIRYHIDPEDLFAITESVEARGIDVVGFYHTHPTGPPRPSETDADRATWPGYSYAVCAFDGHPYLGSWRWTGEEFERETVALVENE